MESLALRYAALLVMAACFSPARAVFIDNGITGDGAWSVDVLDGGQSYEANLDPLGPVGSRNVVYEYLHFVDVGINGEAQELGSTNITKPAYQSGPSQVSSEGSFQGLNGIIRWNSTSSITPGSLTYQSVLNFSSEQPFGALRLIQYLDQDILTDQDESEDPANYETDKLIVSGTPGLEGFKLFVLDESADMGVAHGAAFPSIQGMTFVGWAADKYHDLRDSITGSGGAYTLSGHVDTTDLPPTTDRRFRGLAAYGPADITSALAFEFDPNARSAQVSLTLQGLAEVPLPTAFPLVFSGIAFLSFFRRRRP